MPVGLLYPPGDAWVPLTLDAKNSLPGSPDFPLLTTIGRLKPDAATGRAQADLQLISNRLLQEFPPGRSRALSAARVEVVPLRQLLMGDSHVQLFILLGAVALVLLVACANLANLLLARAASRGKEMALRAALGAERFRLIRQLLTESLLLALTGGILGLLVGLLSVHALKELIPPGIPANVSLDLRRPHLCRLRLSRRGCAFRIGTGYGCFAY